MSILRGIVLFCRNIQSPFMYAILQHLRLPFSLLLLPVFLFAVFDAGIRQANAIDVLWILGLVLHLLVYPSSNAYNSLEDQDVGSIGLVKVPMKVPQSIEWISAVMDVLAVVIAGIFLPVLSTLGLTLYILFSRLYSWRRVRLKKFPLIGFMVVFIFQGACIFIITQLSVGVPVNWAMAMVSSCLIGAIYPLSQIYQHEQDRADGVETMSMKLGYRGTFVLSGTLFVIGAVGFTLFYWQIFPMAVYVFHVCLFASVVYFLFWAYKVWHSTLEANYRQTMLMNLVASAGMNICFIALNLILHQ